MAHHISRDDLYALNHLGANFGITGNGLAKICDRLELPYPTRGYRAKKAAGASVVQIELPERRQGFLTASAEKLAVGQGAGWR
jgi:hypothetical protein